MSGWENMSPSLRSTLRSAGKLVSQRAPLLYDILIVIYRRLPSQIRKGPELPVSSFSDSLRAESDLLSMIDGLPTAIDADEYHRLSTIRMRPADLDLIKTLDPFSDEYRRRVVDIYHRITGTTSYDAAQQELSGFGHVEDIWHSVSPFSFQSTKFVSEFLVSWGAIFDAVDLKAGQSILEYGPGSGQCLLLMARAGIKTFGVDIDAASLEILRRQSDAMGLGVELEQAAFGDGFADKRFDRILFFEAFHHALYFEDVLLKLHDRLNDDGRIVFCGEPIQPVADDSVPLPWGPRMDALSVLCMRRFGWMELGFQYDFFVNALMRNGWLVERRGSGVYRAITYIAKPIKGEIPVGETLAFPAGWGDGEGTHRWTMAEDTVFPLPHRRFGKTSVTIGLVNYLTEPKTVDILAGASKISAVLQSGESTRLSLICEAGIDSLHINSKLSSLPHDARRLGVAVTALVIAPQ